MMTATDITTIGFDADDTLWENMGYFRMTEEQFADLLDEYADHEYIAKHMLKTERKNLKLYGYGVKGFALSMIETALDITENKVEGRVIRQIMELAQEMYAHPIEPLPHVVNVLEKLNGKYRLIVITKGDLFDQERKLAQSGLSDYFDAVEIVSEKERYTYESIFAQNGDGAESSLMIGNSLKSDIIPALEAGAWAVHIPHHTTWEMEHADIPQGFKRFKQIKQLPELLDVLEAA